MLRTGELHPPEESLTPRYDAQVSPNVGGLLQRCLGTSFGRTVNGHEVLPSGGREISPYTVMSSAPPAAMRFPQSRRVRMDVSDHLP